MDSAPDRNAPSPKGGGQVAAGPASSLLASAIQARFGGGDYIVSRDGKIYRRERNGELRKVGTLGDLKLA